MKCRQRKFSHWTCPFCKIAFPDYRRNYESLETRVKNHLVKFHYAEKGLNQLILELRSDYSAKAQKKKANWT